MSSISGKGRVPRQWQVTALHPVWRRGSGRVRYIVRGTPRILRTVTLLVFGLLVETAA